jgi:hypothetical protein
MGRGYSKTNFCRFRSIPPEAAAKARYVLNLYAAEVIGVSLDTRGN